MCTLKEEEEEEEKEEAEEVEAEEAEQAPPPSRCRDKTKSAAGNEELPAGLRRLEPGLKCQADPPTLSPPPT